MHGQDLDCLIVMCPPWDVARPPINILYLAAYAQSQGLRARALDLNARFFNSVSDPSIKNLWDLNKSGQYSPEQLSCVLMESAQEVAEKLVDEIIATDAHVIGFSVHYKNAHVTNALADMIRAKDPRKKIIFGGAEAGTAFVTNNLNSLGADAFVIGEGERTFVEAVKAFQKGETGEGIPGLIVRINGGFSDLQPRPPIQNLDDLPFPDYEQTPLSDYHPSDYAVALPFLLSRGCANRCAFCMDHRLNGKYRMRSVQNAVDEIELLINKYGVTRFEFNDLMCNGRIKSLEEFCDLIIERGIRIQWSSYAVIRKGQTRRLFQKMHNAGCEFLMFGLESAADNVLSKMNKNYTADMAELTLKNCSEAGIQADINLIVGFPGETVADHEQTMAFVRRNHRYVHLVANLGTCMLAPGTAISENQEALGIKMSGPGGTWYMDDGNDLPERNRRLLQMRDTLHEIGLPLHVVNLEPGTSLELAPDVKIEPGVHKIPSSIELLSVFWVDENGASQKDFQPGDRAALVIKFAVKSSVDDPVLRVQLFNDENPYGNERFIFGMNTRRKCVSLANLRPGNYEAALKIESLNLLPGIYRTEVGVWPEEYANEPYAKIENGPPLVVKGNADPFGAKVLQPVDWEVVSQDSKETKTGIGKLNVVDSSGQETDVLQTGKDAAVEFAVKINPNTKALLEAVLYHNGYIQFAHRKPLPLQDCGYKVKLNFTPLHLLQDKYLLVVRMIDQSNQAMISVSHAFVQVIGKPEHGGGLCYVPCSWEISRN